MIRLRYASLLLNQKNTFFNSSLKSSARYSSTMTDTKTDAKKNTTVNQTEPLNSQRSPTQRSLLFRDQLFSQNRFWADSIKKINPQYFEVLSKQQYPKYLWIGCSDSRVPANVLMGLAPGEVFVHRNIANVVVHSDLNCLSVLQYAVEVLKVEHVIVCGHYGCGGVRAAGGHHKYGLIDNWLRHIKDVVIRNEHDLSHIHDEDASVNRLCELNVLQSVNNVVSTTIVQGAWERGQPLSVHGWIYSISDGLLRELADAQDVSSATQLRPIYRMGDVTVKPTSADETKPLTLSAASGVESNHKTLDFQRTPLNKL